MAHESAFRHYEDFLKAYLSTPGKFILDVGGEGGEFERITTAMQHTYCPINIGDAGGGIRLSVERQYDWPLESDKWDAVISSSTFEHIHMFWLTFKEMVRVCKSGGYIYLNAPSTGPNHWDIDCWRFRRDGFVALAKWGGVESIDAFEDYGPNCSQEWHDCVGIFRK